MFDIAKLEQDLFYFGETDVLIICLGRANGHRDVVLTKVNDVKCSGGSKKIGQVPRLL